MFTIFNRQGQTCDKFAIMARITTKAASSSCNISMFSKIDLIVDIQDFQHTQKDISRFQGVK